MPRAYHPWHTTALMEVCKGVRLFEFAFKGRPAHASVDQHEGASALDGVLLTYTNLNALRQFTQDGVRIHGIVSDGGQAVNIIPEHASCKIGVRSADLVELARVSHRVIECARAAAMASGTTLTVTEGIAMAPIKFNAALGAIMADNLRGLGETSTCGARRRPRTSDCKPGRTVAIVLGGNVAGRCRRFTRRGPASAKKPHALRAMQRPRSPWRTPRSIWSLTGRRWSG